MAEKKETAGGFASKFKRKPSKKPATPSKSHPPPQHECQTPDMALQDSSRSATLPAGSDLATMSIPHSPSGGLFSRLRRKFRKGSKGKYDLKYDDEMSSSSPKKASKLRRKSDESYLAASADRVPEMMRGSPKVKAQSVKTKRRSRSEKEEVILIRKDKRISVICKSKNGEPEVIFSNVEGSDDDNDSDDGGIIQEDLESAEEDPYACINHTDSDNPTVEASGLTSPEDSFQQGIDYIEPDYESLDEVNQKKKLFAKVKKPPPPVQVLNPIPEGASRIVYSGSIKELQKPLVSSPEVEPDYESLEEVKLKVRRENK